MTSVLVVGGGSAGTRHARTLADAGAAVVITDPDAERASATGFDVMPYSLDSFGGLLKVVTAKAIRRARSIALRSFPSRIPAITRDISSPDVSPSAAAASTATSTWDFIVR